jgi:hypothetical protein
MSGGAKPNRAFATGCPVALCVPSLVKVLPLGLLSLPANAIRFPVIRFYLPCEEVWRTLKCRASYPEACLDGKCRRVLALIRLVGGHLLDMGAEAARIV